MSILKDLRIGLDVDGLCACFSAGVIKRAGEMGLAAEFPTSCKEVDCWDMCDMFSRVMRGCWKDENFWLGLPVLEGALPLPFIPYVYITSRPISGMVTKQWLDGNGFPDAPVITVSHHKEKLAHAKNLKLDLYIDDLYHTVRDMREAGVNCLLYKAPYQRGHKEECRGLPTINHLNEVVNYI